MNGKGNSIFLVKINTTDKFYFCSITPIREISGKKKLSMKYLIYVIFNLSLLFLIGCDDIQNAKTQTVIEEELELPKDTFFLNFYAGMNQYEFKKQLEKSIPTKTYFPKISANTNTFDFYLPNKMILSSTVNPIFSDDAKLNLEGVKLVIYENRTEKIKFKGTCELTFLLDYIKDSDLRELIGLYKKKYGKPIVKEVIDVSLYFNIKYDKIIESYEREDLKYKDCPFGLIPALKSLNATKMIWETNSGRVEISILKQKKTIFSEIQKHLRTKVNFEKINVKQIEIIYYSLEKSLKHKIDKKKSEARFDSLMKEQSIKRKRMIESI